jgi:hypothetical protein
VAHEDVAIVEHPREPRVRVRVRAIELERDLAHERPCAVDDDDPPWPGLGDHDVSVAEWLQRVHLDGPTGVMQTRVVGPHDLACRRVEFDDLCGSALQHQVPVRQDVQVVDRPPRHLPLDLAAGADDGEPTLALDDETVLRGAEGRERERASNEEGGVRDHRSTTLHGHGS